MTGPTTAERDRQIREAIMTGMKNDELPDLTCSVCANIIEYTDVLREGGRVVSVRTKCPCGHSSGSILGI